MREILFRGKRTDNGEWIEGHLLWYEDGRVRITPRHTDVFCPNYGDSVILHITYEVIPETIGQYTGINVGNEKLFEGDIVECHEDYDDSWGFSKTSVVRAVVIWDEENFYWAFEIEKKYRQPFNDWTWDNSFINGNIHDNPELPKGGVEE